MQTLIISIVKMITMEIGLFNISGIATVSHVSSTYCTVSYMDRKVGGGINQLSIYHTTDTTGLQFHHVLNDGIVNAYERQWKDVAIPFKLPFGNANHEYIVITLRFIILQKGSQIVAPFFDLSLSKASL